MGFDPVTIDELFKGKAGDKELGGQYGFDPNSPYLGQPTSDLELRARKAQKEIVQQKAALRAFGKESEIPKPPTQEPSFFERILNALDYPGKLVRENVFGIKDFTEYFEKKLGLTGKEAIEVPLPFEPQVPKAPDPFELLKLTKPTLVKPETPGAESVFGTSPDPQMFAKMASAKAMGVLASVVTDPLTWLGFGSITSGGGRALLAFMPKGPFTGIGEAKTLIKGQMLQDAIKSSVSQLAKTRIGEAIGKAFIPKFGIPEEYHLLNDEMKRNILHATINLNKRVEEIFTNLNEDELRYLTFSREFPAMLDNLTIGPLLARANPTTTEKLKQLINLNNVNLDKVRKANESFSPMLQEYAARLVDAGVITEERLRDLYVPHMLRPEAPPGFRGTPMPRIREYSGQIQETKPFFVKARHNDTLVDVMNRGYDPILEADLISRQFGRAVEVVLQKRKFLHEVLDKFGIPVTRSELADFEPLLKAGYKIYMPSGSLRFYPQYVVPSGPLARGYSPVTGLVELAIDDIKKGIGISKNAPAYLVPGPIANDLKHAERVFGNEKAMNALLDFMDKVLTYWKANVTIVTPGFHIRNEMGNLFNAWLAGLNNPKRFEQAWKVVKGENLRIAEWNSAQVFDMAIQLGVYKPEGAFVGEITSVVPTLQGKATTSQLINPFSQRFAPVEAGRAFGSAVENNARMALFIDRLVKGDSPTEAANVVKKYLFDYGELTTFEREVMRRIVPFYTWLRKNIPLQFEHIFTTPGKYAMIQDLLGAIPEKQEQLLPAEQRGVYQRATPLTVAVPLKIGGLPTTLSFDLPMSDLALEFFREGSRTGILGSLSNISPAIAAAERIFSLLTKKEARVPAPPIYSQLITALPPELRKLTNTEDVKSFVTGKPVPGMNPEVKAFLLDLFPLIAKLGRILPTEERLADPSYIAAVSSTLTGARVTPTDVKKEKARNVIQYRRMLEEEINRLLKEGEIDAKKYGALRRFLKLR